MDEKRKKAVALQYKINERAPKLIAKGADLLAEKIINLAQKYNVPVYPDSDLVEILYQLDIMQEIPPQLYQAVAEVLAFVYLLNQKLKEQNID